MEALQSVDEAIVLYVAEHFRTGTGNALMVFISTLGDAGAIWLITGAALMMYKKHRRNGFALLICVAFCTLISTVILKNIVTRPRPYVELAELTALVRPPDRFSFPSGHAASSFAASYALARYYGKRGALSYIAASMIAGSRVYVGVHYLSDIIAGAVIGTASAWVACRAFSKILKERNTSEKSDFPKDL